VNRRLIIVATLALGLSACSATGLDESGVQSAAFEQGEKIYFVSCVQCHGSSLRGTDQGPPLIWDLYVSRHHSDRQFKKAVSEGVQEHHWRFGDMPAFPDLTESDVDNVVFFVRSVLRKHGIR
jgi:mono/diheme cytochrome c family protein